MLTKQNKLLFYFCLFYSASIFLWSAYFNYSYLHPDEYYQIVEFASFKLGITPAASLPWEYAARIRPAFQPFIAYSIFRILDAVHIEDHYAHLLVLRAVSALFTLFSITVFCLANLPFIRPSHHRLFILTTFLFWAPYLFGVRFSSEAWSGDCMLLAVSLLLYVSDGGINDNTLSRASHQPSNPRRLFTWGFIGLLLGVAFLFRFQTAFFTVGIGAWLIFIRRQKLLPVLSLIAGGAVALMLGVLVDKWFYGDWLCSPWLYFESNIVKGVASEFGTKPFWSYIVWLFTFLSPPVGIAAVLGLFFLFVKMPKHLYTWMLLPFLLAHSLTGHKEQRFIFPLLLYIPVVCTLSYQYIVERRILPQLSANKWLKGATKALFAAGNFILLFFLVIVARFCSNDPKNFAPYIHEAARSSVVNILYTDPGRHPYILERSRDKENIYPGYLREKNIISTSLTSWLKQPDSTLREKDGLSAKYKDKDTIQLAVINKYELEHSPDIRTSLVHREVVASTIPLWPGWSLTQSIRNELDKNTFLLIKLN